MKNQNFTTLELAMIHDYLVKQRDNEYYEMDKQRIDQLTEKLYNMIDAKELEELLK